MSFNDFETSTSEGQSARLYQFDRSATVVWRYTSADRSIKFDGHNWSPLPISDDGIRMTGEASADTVRVTLPASAAVAQLFRSTPPSEEIFLTVYDYDATAADAEVCWVGSVSSVAFPRAGQAELVCDSLSASMQRSGLRLRYERSCPHSVYDDSCRAAKALHATPVVVTELNGTHIWFGTSNITDIGAFCYGAAEWHVDGTTEMRGIEVANGTRAQLIGGTDGLAIGDTVTLYPGCDGLRSTCNDRFNNLPNHGGFPHMPGESIYGKRLW